MVVDEVDLYNYDGSILLRTKSDLLKNGDILIGGLKNRRNSIDGGWWVDFGLDIGRLMSIDRDNAYFIAWIV